MCAHLKIIWIKPVRICLKGSRDSCLLPGLKTRGIGKFFRLAFQSILGEETQSDRPLLQ